MKRKHVVVDSATETKPKTNNFSITVKRSAGRPLGQSDDLTMDELKTLLRLPDKREKVGFRDYAVLLTFCNTPMRVGELKRLTVGSMIDEGTKKFISYKALKKRKCRDKQTGEIKVKQRPYWLKIPIATDVYSAIIRYIQNEHKTGKIEHTQPLFMTTGIRGPYEKRPLTYNAAAGIIAKYLKKAGINKRVTPHSFRATYLTMRADGHSPKTLCDLSGHADIRGVMPYLRSSEEKRRAAALSHVAT